MQGYFNAAKGVKQEFYLGIIYFKRSQKIIRFLEVAQAAQFA
jgi:hypothetical protein